MLRKLLGFTKPISARDHQEGHRAATALELLYDLVVVIAIAIAAGALHHAISENHIASGVLYFLLTFWSIWWAWIGFTWFASYYDNDDTTYRICVFIQLAGCLVLAAGIKQAFEHQDFVLIMTGYVIMRLSQIFLWARIYVSVPEDRGAALRYAGGMMLCQIAWSILVLAMPKSMMVYGFVFLAACEHLVPFFGEKKRVSKWHRGHMIERYGLLTIIVLGESLLSLTHIVKEVSFNFDSNLMALLIGGFILFCTMWWMYFKEEEHPSHQYSTISFVWGYGHAPIFCAIAATGVGLAVAKDYYTGHSEVSETVVMTSIALPVIVFLLFMWLVHDVFSDRSAKKKMIYPASALCTLGMIFVPYGIIGIALIMVIAISRR